MYFYTQTNPKKHWKRNTNCLGGTKKSQGAFKNDATLTKKRTDTAREPTVGKQIKQKWKWSKKAIKVGSNVSKKSRQLWWLIWSNKQCCYFDG